MKIKVRPEPGSGRWVAAGVVAVAMLWSPLAGCSKSESQPGRGSGAGGNALPVEALVLTPQLIENRILTTGTLLANEEVELRPEISGRVTEVLFEEGSPVRKGDVLVRINDREISAELKRKQLQEKLASDDEQRKRSLLEKNGISREEYERVLNTLHMVQAEREVIESQLSQTEITAPMTGVVGLRYVSVGGYVTPSRLLATMQSVDTLKVEFSVPEKYAGKLAAGTRVHVTVGDSPDGQEGTIYAVESKIDLATRTLKARARLPNRGGRLLPGAFARIQITLESIPEAIVVPASAILPQLEGERVFLCENGRARSVPVTTGIRTDRSVQITAGLNVSDTLILTGLLQVGEGAPVRITNALTP